MVKGGVQEKVDDDGDDEMTSWATTAARWSLMPQVDGGYAKAGEARLVVTAAERPFPLFPFPFSLRCFFPIPACLTTTPSCTSQSVD